jgi:eukaryotic translation initiation factor 2C
VNVSTGRGRLAGCRPETLREFAKNLIGMASQHGLLMSQPCHIENAFNYNGRGSFERDLFERYMKRFPQLRILIFFIPKQDEIYHELKTVAELRNGLVTQCISQDNERKCTQPAFVANVMLKINAKVQGVNVVLEAKSRPVLLNKCTMIVGLDVTHPAPADKLSQSIAACVGTYDRDFTKYFARVVVQPKPKKEIVDLAAMMIDLLDKFKVVNKRLPSYIVIYRDGVSEGQFDEVMVKELAKLKEAFKKYENFDPKIMFMVVQKRNHTRFMPVDARGGSRTGNVHPGTVVDRTITSNVLFDFYIVAHAGMIGTSRPVHYYVLYDEICAPADEIQKMTYYLSYLYPRCTKSISVPPPVMYAHLSAKRARSHIFIIDESDGQSTVSSGSGGYRQLSEHETQVLNDKLVVQQKLNGVLYYI